MQITVDKYTLIQIIGQTSKTTIYRGKDANSGLDVAIKASVASRDEALRVDAIDDYRNEGGLIGRINHEGIVTPYDAFVMKIVEQDRWSLRLNQNAVHSIDVTIEEGDRMYLVREYVHGSKLDDYMAEHMERELKFEIHALDLMIQICGAVIYCHDNDINHNDLKPKNILVTDQGRIKILDFGLAQYLNSRRRKGVSRGTPPFASPEQYSRDFESTPASDVYSLGAVFYHMLTGKEIPAANERMQHKGRFQSEISRLEDRSTWSFGLWEIIRKATQLDLEQRYMKVEVMKNDLEALKEKEYQRRTSFKDLVINGLKSVISTVSQMYYGQGQS